MDSSGLIDLIGFAPQASLVAALGSDVSWNVAADWGFGSQWTVERVPVGIRFRLATNGLVSQEVVIVRGWPHERATHENVLSWLKVPAQLVFVERSHAAHDRPAPHNLSPGLDRHR